MYKYIKAAATAGEVDENGVLYTEEKVIENDEYEEREDIIEVNAPYCIEMGERAFYKCTNLQSVLCPQVKTIGFAAFTGCKNLNIVDCPNCTFIDNRAFRDCVNLHSCNYADNAKIGYCAFEFTPMDKHDRFSFIHIG